MAVLEVGMALPPFKMTITRELLIRYAGATRDLNPIHWSDRRALEAGLPGVIAHGMLTAGIALRVVGDWCGDPNRLVSYYTRFTKPVYVPDDDAGITLHVSARVVDVAEDVVTISVTALVGGDPVLSAAMVKVRRV